MPPQAADQHGEALTSLCTDLAAKRHVIAVSNRGPITFVSSDNGEISATTSSGQSDPISLLREKLPVTWVSVASSGADRSVAQAAGSGSVAHGLPNGSSLRLVSPSRREFHRYYNIICNPLLWFLHHRAWGFTHTPNIDREAHTAWNQGMVAVSTMLAEAVAAEAATSDKPPAVLLRGYHTQLVAAVVRKLVPGALIHFSPSIPWPGPSDMSVLPADWRKLIMESVLACDFVELRSDRDARNLLACIEEFLPDVVINHSDRNARIANGHVMQLRVQHPTIDREQLFAVADSRRCATYVERFSEDDRYRFVTAERAEPQKNIVRAIRAFGTLLDETPALGEEIRYLLVLAPPPPHLSQYRRYVSEIEKAARDVNSRHRARAGRPVEIVLDNNYSMALAAVTVADTLISIPLADAACTTALSAPLVNEQNCTLLLSETSSVSELFGSGASVVSPADVHSIKQQMVLAVHIADEEREQRFRLLESLTLRLHDESALYAELTDLLSPQAD